MNFYCTQCWRELTALKQAATQTATNERRLRELVGEMERLPPRLNE